MINIVSAQNGDALEHLVALSQEYTGWMVSEVQSRYPELDIAGFTANRKYDDVRKKFPGEHVPPHGGLFIALSDGEVCGCVALGRLTETVSEMRTLYVRPAYRGTGIAKRLIETVSLESRTLGYNHMRLDTLAFMIGAQTLYRALGFYDIDPYYELSASLKPYLRFFELELGISRA